MWPGPPGLPAIRDLNVYVKPEDGKAYYTVNDKTSDSIDL